jgi:hypothetical protein
MTQAHLRRIPFLLLSLVVLLAAENFLTAEAHAANWTRIYDAGNDIIFVDIETVQDGNGVMTFWELHDHNIPQSSTAGSYGSSILKHSMNFTKRVDTISHVTAYSGRNQNGIVIFDMDTNIVQEIVPGSIIEFVFNYMREVNDRLLSQPR